MASLTKLNSGMRRIQFIHPSSNKRLAIYLGKMPERLAKSVKANIETIIACKAAGVALDTDTAGWLAKISDDLQTKLAAVGLCDPLTNTRAHAFVHAYMETKAALKPASRNRMDYAIEKLLAFLPETIALREVTEGHADDWHTGMVNAGLKDATRRTYAQVAKQIFKSAVRKGLIPSNPFQDLKTGAVVAKKHHLSEAEASKLLFACPDHRWRTLFALTRYAGLRCPSETHGLTWKDIDWDKRRMLVRSPKTERFEGHEEREVPIIPRLLPILEDAFARATDKHGRVVELSRNNLPRGMRKIRKRAKIAHWAKLFNSQRASCETDWLADHPEHVVSKAIGHDVAVGRRHYSQLTEETLVKMSNPKEQKKAA